jgi:NAD+ synthase (glutamine-hydrolysing)
MRLGLAQLNYKIGDFEQNFQKIEQAIKNYATQCDVIVFSELCLSGYYPKDLRHNRLFLKN